MHKTASSIIAGFALFTAIAAPALAYTPEELRAFALDAQGVARQVLDKCSDAQQVLMGEALQS